jgi:hypothetical protein
MFDFGMTCMVKKENEIKKEWKKVEQEEMKEEDHQLELKKNYEQDEEYEESDD